MQTLVNDGNDRSRRAPTREVDSNRGGRERFGRGRQGRTKVFPIITSAQPQSHAMLQQSTSQFGRGGGNRGRSNNHSRGHGVEKRFNNGLDSCLAGNVKTASA